MNSLPNALRFSCAASSGVPATLNPDPSKTGKSRAPANSKAGAPGWLRQWIAAVTVLDIDDGTMHSYSAIGLELKGKGKPIPTNDLWIAALCRQHSLPLVSRDKHFDFVAGLRHLDWR